MMDAALEFPRQRSSLVGALSFSKGVDPGDQLFAQLAGNDKDYLFVFGSSLALNSLQSQSFRL